MRVREVDSWDDSSELDESSLVDSRLEVLVEVVNSVVVEGAGVVIVVSSGAVVGWLEGEVVGSLVVSSSVVVSEVVTPVDKAPVWRLKRAMASSRGSATTWEARREDARARETTLKCLMLM